MNYVHIQLKGEIKMVNSESSCPFVKRIPDYIIRNQKPRVLGMVIAILEESTEALSASQISSRLKDRGYRYYPATRTCASLLGKFKSLFEEVAVVKVGNVRTTWNVKIYKLRDGWNVDRKI